MKIHVTHSSNFDYKKELYEPIRRSHLNTLHEIRLPHETSESPSSTKESIQDQDVVLAEVSYPSTGQGIELGWADALGVRIVCFHKKGTKPSSSLRTVSVIFFEYENDKEMIDGIEKNI